MTPASVILALVTLQRLGELALAQRNTRRLLARGAYEVGAEHYPLIVALHTAWLGSLWLFAWNALVDLSWLGVYLVLQALRVWVLAALGSRWTTRIIVLPDAPLVRAGPYRYLAHPNYVIVAAEIAVLPLVFELVWHTVLFTGLNAAVLLIRIRAETAAWRNLGLGP